MQAPPEGGLSISQHHPGHCPPPPGLPEGKSALVARSGSQGGPGTSGPQLSHHTQHRSLRYPPTPAHRGSLLAEARKHREESRHEVLLLSAGSFQIFHADAKEKAEQEQEGHPPFSHSSLPWGTRRIGGSPPGATELPGPRRVIHLAERQQTAQKVREEEESRKKGAHQPPRKSNSPFHAESTQIHCTD